MDTTVEILENAETFLGWTQPVYEAEEGKHTLMLGVARRAAQAPESLPQKPFFAVVHDGAQTLLCSALRTPPHFLLVHSDPVDKNALDLLAERLNADGIVLPGSNGMADASDAFASLWCERSGSKAVLRHRLRSYVLREVIPPPKPIGRMRLADTQDVHAIAVMLIAMGMETQAAVAEQWTAQRVGALIERKDLFVWEVDGFPRSTAMLTRPTRQAMTVSGVYTFPANRGKGFASALVAGVSQVVLDRGYRMAQLFTDLANPVSNAIYQKIGYQPVCDYHEYRYFPG